MMRSIKLGLVALLSLTILSTTTNANAATGCGSGTPVCTHYYGYYCIAQNWNAFYEGDVWDDYLSFAMSDTNRGVCPVPKTTSYPGASLPTDDALDKVVMNVSAPGGTGSFSCALHIYQAAVATSASNNLLGTYPGTWSQTPEQVGTTNFTITFSPPYYYPTAGWWISSSAWLYSEIDCDMNRGSPGEITEYWVAEEGNQSHSKFIYPSSFCYFDAYSGTDGYEISGFDGPPNYMEATRFPGPANGTFAMYCPAADSNDAIDVYIGPGTASNTTVVNESGSTVFTVNQCSSPCGFPLQLKSGILDWNTWSDSFEILSAGDGDARFTSYRTFEEIP